MTKMTKNTRDYVKGARSGNNAPANMKRMKSGPKGAGRPIGTFPKKYESLALEMWRDKKSLDDIRQTLITMGYNISMKAIQDTVERPIFVPVVVPASPTKKFDLSSAAFGYDEKTLVDDLILEGETPSKILEVLAAHGLEPSLEEVAAYVVRRSEELSKLDKATLEQQRLVNRSRSTHSKLLEVWRNMPEYKKYSEKTFIALLGELRMLQTMIMDAGKNNLPTDRADEANAEIEAKLGLLDASTAG